MATVLGKRKSRIQKADPSVSHEEAQAKLARFFESKFLPLFPTATSTPSPETGEGGDDEGQGEEAASDLDNVDDDDGDDSVDDAWDGISEGEEREEEEEEEEESPTVVEVVSHTETYSTALNPLDKRESRAWLSSRPPLAAPLVSDAPSSSSSSKNKRGKAAAAAGDEDEDAPSLLKNDLALQRLLSESHLFSTAAAKGGGSGGGDNATEHVGRNRHLATDLRLAALGSKTSVYRQAKMPMALRKGMRAAAEGREAKRRREARENGVVLEKPTTTAAAIAAFSSAATTAASSARKKGRRKGPSARDFGAPSVGRVSNGTLTLSKKEIASVQGGSRNGAGFSKKRRK
ncbi:hypothetical protein SAMD00023353_2600370 [Rosellinia necatrix]|uniref:Protein FAF1 n=1 Tax=Rosellinia necatrix TaxID=77044 RepID=A0A1W2THA5_ROSNE|nr:hypothetical protein SAMD00023353_2600370 [Rosellinia necatrix]